MFVKEICTRIEHKLERSVVSDYLYMLSRLLKIYFYATPSQTQAMLAREFVIAVYVHVRARTLDAVIYASMIVRFVPLTPAIAGFAYHFRRAACGLSHKRVRERAESREFIPFVTLLSMRWKVKINTG